VSKEESSSEKEKDEDVLFNLAHLRYTNLLLLQLDEDTTHKHHLSSSSSSSVCNLPIHENRHANTTQTLVDTALLAGLESAMTQQEQLYITSLMTSGDPNHVAQAVMALEQIAQLSRQRSPLRSSQHPTSTESSSSCTTTAAASTTKVPQRTTTTHHPSSSSPTITTGYSNYNRVGTSGGSTSSSSSKLRQEQILIQQRQRRNGNDYILYLYNGLYVSMLHIAPRIYYIVCYPTFGFIRMRFCLHFTGCTIIYSVKASTNIHSSRSN